MSLQRRFSWLLAGLLVVAVVTEAAGRYWGLHHPVLFERTTYGYRVQPSQDIKRFGNRVYFNAFGLRSAETGRFPPAGTLRVLCLGDSVTYGGATTGQEETYPSILQEQMTGLPTKVEVLNASAPGWAIDNELGWLREQGTLASRYVVLTMSTHDLFQPLAPSAVVGGHPSFPNHAPIFALQEIVARYVLPRMLPPEQWMDPGVSHSEPWSDQLAKDNRDSLAIMDQLVRDSGGQLVVLLSTEEIAPEMASMADRARANMIEAMAQRHVDVLMIDDAIRQQGRAVLYRDTVHPTIEGNRALATAVSAWLRPRLAG